MKLKKEVKVATLIILEILTVLFVMLINTNITMGMRLLSICIMLICENLTFFMEEE